MKIREPGHDQMPRLAAADLKYKINFLLQNPPNFPLAHRLRNKTDLLKEQSLAISAATAFSTFFIPLSPALIINKKLLRQIFLTWLYTLSLHAVKSFHPSFFSKKGSDKYDKLIFIV